MTTDIILTIIAIILIAEFGIFMILIVYGLIKKEKAMSNYRKRKDPKCRKCKNWETIDCPSSRNCFATDTKPYFEEISTNEE